MICLSHFIPLALVTLFQNVAADVFRMFSCPQCFDERVLLWERPTWAVMVSFINVAS